MLLDIHSYSLLPSLDTLCYDHDRTTRVHIDPGITYVLLNYCPSLLSISSNQNMIATHEKENYVFSSKKLDCLACYGYKTAAPVVGNEDYGHSGIPIERK